jgi:hypothetical protein
MDRIYIDKSADGKAIDPDQRTKSFKYGKQNVPFAQADVDLLKYKSEKEMKMLGFTAAKNVPRMQRAPSLHYFMSLRLLLCNKPQLICCMFWWWWWQVTWR